MEQSKADTGFSSKDPLLHVVFGPGLRSIGTTIVQGEAFSNLRKVGEISTAETCRETDCIIEAVKQHFKASESNPSPSVFFNGHRNLIPVDGYSFDVPDLASVVANVKSATIVDQDEVLASPHGRELLLRAVSLGLSIVTCADSSHKNLIIGEERVVNELAGALYELERAPWKQGPGPGKYSPEREQLHKRIGELLGYPEEAIHRFLFGKNFAEKCGLAELGRHVASNFLPIFASPFVDGFHYLYHNSMVLFGIAKPINPPSETDRKPR